MTFPILIIDKTDVGFGKMRITMRYRDRGHVEWYDIRVGVSGDEDLVALACCLLKIDDTILNVNTDDHGDIFVYFSPFSLDKDSLT